MKNKPLLLVLGVLALVLATLGVYHWRRASQLPAPAPGAAGPASPAPTATYSDTTQDNGFGELVSVTITEDKTQLAKLYKRPDIAEFYKYGEGADEFSQAEGAHKATPPPFDFNQSLAGKSYLDLLLLRNELYARNGYCFMNSTVRSYFDQRKWYRPVWEDDTYNDQGEITAKAVPIRYPSPNRKPPSPPKCTPRNWRCSPTAWRHRAATPCLGSTLW